jgi:branched-chain amino acid transport system substrate-binding protein
MAITRRSFLGATALATVVPAASRAQTEAGPPIRIGDINSYSTQPTFTEPYRKGWQLAAAQINDLGGVLGRKIEVISVDDGGQPDKAVQLATELVEQRKVDLLAGGYLSDVAQAISFYALAKKKLYVAGEALSDAITWQKGNRYTYRVRPSASMLATMLANGVASLPAKRWTTVAPGNDDGREAVAAFRAALSRHRQDVSFAGEQWPRPGAVDGRAVAAAIAQAAPDAVFNALSGADLLALLQSGPSFADRTVASMLTGDPETLDILGAHTPPGWIVTGYPWQFSDLPANKQFVLDYQTRYPGETPGMGSVVGFAMIKAIVSGIQKSGGVEPESMADGFAGATFETPFGLCSFRAIDHQSTLGSFVGRLAVQNGRGGMVDFQYVDGAAVMPADDVVRKLRPT